MIAALLDVVVPACESSDEPTFSSTAAANLADPAPPAAPQGEAAIAR